MAGENDERSTYVFIICWIWGALTNDGRWVCDHWRGVGVGVVDIVFETLKVDWYCERGLLEF